MIIEFKTCHFSPHHRSFLLVSTMDGKVSALNLEKEGRVEWAVDAGQTPLLSSSISELQVSASLEIEAR